MQDHKRDHTGDNKPDPENQIELTTYDRLIRAWENSKEMVRDFEMYSKRIEEEDIRDVFKQFAEEEGYHAEQLRSMILEYNNSAGRKRH